MFGKDSGYPLTEPIDGPFDNLPNFIVATAGITFIVAMTAVSIYDFFARDKGISIFCWAMMGVFAIISILRWHPNTAKKTEDFLCGAFVMAIYMAISHFA